jgi:hypothetical protein
VPPLNVAPPSSTVVPPEPGAAELPPLEEAPLEEPPVNEPPFEEPPVRLPPVSFGSPAAAA